MMSAHYTTLIVSRMMSSYMTYELLHDMSCYMTLLHIISFDFQQLL
jgi:hypothetical protein